MNDGAWLKGVIIAAGIAIGYFLILPYPFTSSPIFCSEDSRTGITDCQTNEQTRWSWFGGYHATLERVVPMSSESKESNASKYYGITRGGILKLAVISVVLGGASYLAYRQARASRNAE